MGVEPDMIESTKKEIEKDTAEFSMLFVDDEPEVEPPCKMACVVMHSHLMYDMEDDESDNNLESLNDASSYDSRIDIEYAQYWQNRIIAVRKQTSQVESEVQVMVW